MCWLVLSLLATVRVSAFSACPATPELLQTQSLAITDGGNASPDSTASEIAKAIQQMKDVANNSVLNTSVPAFEEYRERSRAKLPARAGVPSSTAPSHAPIPDTITNGSGSVANASQQVPSKPANVLVKPAFNENSFNFASSTAGAKILAASPEMKHSSAILSDESDYYAMWPCAAPKNWVVVQLSEEAVVQTVMLSNAEYYSSGVEKLQLLGSHKYPTKEWRDLGTLHLANVRQKQFFQLGAHELVRYLKIRFVSFYGNEQLCTLTTLRVHGMTTTEHFREELDARKAQSALPQGAATADGFNASLAADANSSSSNVNTTTSDQVALPGSHSEQASFLQWSLQEMCDRLASLRCQSLNPHTSFMLLLQTASCASQSAMSLCLDDAHALAFSTSNLTVRVSESATGMCALREDSCMNTPLDALLQAHDSQAHSADVTVVRGNLSFPLSHNTSVTIGVHCLVTGTWSNNGSACTYVTPHNLTPTDIAATVGLTDNNSTPEAQTTPTGAVAVQGQPPRPIGDAPLVFKAKGASEADKPVAQCKPILPAVVTIANELPSSSPSADPATLSAPSSVAAPTSQPVTAGAQPDTSAPQLVPSPSPPPSSPSSAPSPSSQLPTIQKGIQNVRHILSATGTSAFPPTSAPPSPSGTFSPPTPSPSLAPLAAPLDGVPRPAGNQDTPAPALAATVTEKEREKDSGGSSSSSSGNNNNKVPEPVSIAPSPTPSAAPAPAPLATFAPAPVLPQASGIPSSPAPSTETVAAASPFPSTLVSQSTDKQSVFQLIASQLSEIETNQKLHEAFVKETTSAMEAKHNLLLSASSKLTDALAKHESSRSAQLEELMQTVRAQAEAIAKLQAEKQAHQEVIEQLMSRVEALETKRARWLPFG